jgi:ABC-type transport system involved in multi-copper enzyme maturation permease subunit
MNADAIWLVPRRTHGWNMGFANMLAKENAAWWRTRRWWIQALVAVFFVDGSMLANHQLAGASIERIASFNNLLVIAGVLSIAAILLGQDSILGELHSGTAAWVLSKPLRRPAFLLAKLAANGLGLLVTMVFIPGVIAYCYFDLVGGVKLPVAGFAGAMGLVYLYLLFYMILAMMLATLFSGRGPVLGIAMGAAWGYMLVQLPAWLEALSPWKLLIGHITDTGTGFDLSLAGRLIVGEQLTTLVPIIMTVLWCVLFTAIAFWRIRRVEF